MNLLERFSTFKTRVKAKYRLGSQDNEQEYFEKYIRSIPRLASATAFDYNSDRDYISFYFEEFKTEEEKKEYKKNCIYTVLI